MVVVVVVAVVVVVEVAAQLLSTGILRILLLNQKF